MTDYHHAENVRVAAPGRREQNGRAADEISVIAIHHGDEDGPHCQLTVKGDYPSSSHFGVSMTLDDLDALRHAITRLLVKVQAEADTPPTTSVDMPAAAVGMVAGIPTPSVSVG